MRKEKEFLKDAAQNKISASDIMVAFNYSKMDANLNADFRDSINNAGGDVYVIKKRVLIKSAKEEGLDLNLKELPGHIAIMCAGADDAVASTKALYTFKKDNADKLEVLGGQFQGQSCVASDFEKISKLPSQDEMRAQLLSVFEAPMSQTLSVVNALLTSVVHCLENKASQN